MKKRILSMLVVAAMAISVLSVPVAATEEQSETEDISQAESVLEENDEEDPGDAVDEEFDVEIEPKEEADEAISDDSGDPAAEPTDSNMEEQVIDMDEPAIDSEEVLEEASETESLAILEPEYTSSDIFIGDALTADDLAGSISTYAATNCDTVKVKGTCNYDYAYQVLDLVNKERAAEGLSALTMDADLLDAAMQRAAECSLYISHTRPSGLSCFTVSSKAAGENLAVGQGTPSGVMSSWMGSSGHRGNILGSNYKSIGIGCFTQGNRMFWIQIFGTSSASSVSKSGSSSQTFSIDVSSDTITYLLLDPDTADGSFELNVGDTMTLTGNVNATDIQGSSFKWSSSNPSVATVNSSGKVTAVGVGNADITAKTSTGQLSKTVTVTCVSGSLKKVNGVWGYYKKGTLQTSYTGFATNSSGKWYVEKGIVTKSTNGVFKDKDGAIGTAGNWYYVLNSKVQTGFTGLANYKNSSGWWYITKGKVDRSYTGLAKNKNGWFYVKSGKVDRSYTGFASNSNGKWYVSSGKVTKTKNGVIKDSKGAIGSNTAWYYVLNSKVQTGFTGLANYSNSSGWWYITKGKVDRSYTGLAKNKNGWFYLTNGKVNRSYTGLATNSNGTWYVKSGKVQKSFTGTVTISGKKYSVTNGKIKA